MSRIGKLPINVPAGVTVQVDELNTVTVKGPKGTLVQTVNPDITLKQENGVLTLLRPSDAKPHKAMHGLYRSLVHNMVVGVTDGFTKELEIIGVGYRATAKGPDAIDLALGYSHPIEVKAPEGITFEVPSPNRIAVKGTDKEVVGQVAADIR